MFYKDRGINFSAGNTRDMRGQHFWGFPFYRLALFGISSLPAGTTGILTLPPAGRKKVAFRCRCDKKYNFYLVLVKIGRYYYKYIIKVFMSNMKILLSQLVTRYTLTLATCMNPKNRYIRSYYPTVVSAMDVCKISRGAIFNLLGPHHNYMSR